MRKLIAIILLIPISLISITYGLGCDLPSYNKIDCAEESNIIDLKNQIPIIDYQSNSISLKIYDIREKSGFGYIVINTSCTDTSNDFSHNIIKFKLNPQRFLIDWTMILNNYPEDMYKYYTNSVEMRECTELKVSQRIALSIPKVSCELYSSSESYCFYEDDIISVIGEEIKNTMRDGNTYHFYKTEFGYYTFKESPCLNHFYNQIFSIYRTTVSNDLYESEALIENSPENLHSHFSDGGEATCSYRVN